MALSVYLGLRARRRGRRLAFYLRAVVTLDLLCSQPPMCWYHAGQPRNGPTFASVRSVRPPPQ
jgi:hypothetical protein